MIRALLSLIAGVVAAFFFAAAFVAISSPASAAGDPTARCLSLRGVMVAAYPSVWPEAPRALLAAQVAQESACRPLVKSPFAAGLTQFTAPTAGDMARWYPDILSPARPLDIWWALRAQAVYMARLHRSSIAAGRGECDRWEFALRSYNGGAGHIRREKRIAARAGADPLSADAVAMFCKRRRAACIENTEYPHRIFARAPAFVSADFGGSPDCARSPE